MKTVYSWMISVAVVCRVILKGRMTEDSENIMRLSK